MLFIALVILISSSIFKAKTNDMKPIVILIFIFQSSFSFGQNLQNKDTIQPPIYDTTGIDIRSTNSFYFCSKLYAIPRICKDQNQYNCCSFRGHISKWFNKQIDGEISCYNGTTFSWMIYETEEMAKEIIENNQSQFKRQMKKYSKEEIKLFICDKEVKAYKINCTTNEDHSFSEIVFFGAINSYFINGSLTLHNEKTSKELPQLFQQLVRF